MPRYFNSCNKVADLLNKTETEKREKLTCAAQPAGRPSKPAQPTTAVVLLAPVGQACGRRARTAGAPRHQPVCLPPSPARRRGVSSRCRPDPLALSLSLSRAAPSLSLSRPNTTVAAVRHSYRLRPPLAPPTSSGAPPRLPLPPHRSTAPRKPCIAVTSPFPSSASDHRRRQIRRLRRVPEPASTPTATAVSPRSVSPFFPGLSRPLGPSSTSAESSTPPTMSPSWPRSP